MKRGAIVAGLAAMWMTMACGTDVNLGTRPQFSTGGNTLTVLMYDAITGAPVINASMSLRIGPDLTAAVSDGTTNVYSFTNLPSAVFPVVATATGYLTFTGATTKAMLPGIDPTNPTYVVAELAMYPTTSIASPYTIKVFDPNGNPVTGGQLVVNMKIPVGGAPTSPLFPVTFTNALGGDYGTVLNTKTYALTSGTFQIPATDLIYGASYTVDVIGATDANGNALKPTNAGAGEVTITPYTDFPYKDIFMSPVTSIPVVLQESDDPTDATGKIATGTSLKITFDEPVEACTQDASDPHDFYTFIESDGTKCTGPATPTPSACTIATGQDSAGGTMGTFPAKPPNYTTADDATFVIDPSGLFITLAPTSGLTYSDPKDYVAIMFHDIFVHVKGTPVSAANCFDISTLCVRDTPHGSPAACTSATVGHTTGHQVDMTLIIQRP